MATISKLLHNHQALNIRAVVKDAMFNTQDALVKSQQDQLLHGKKSDGSKIGKYGSGKSYRRLKFNLNPLAGYGNVDLKLTGAFYLGIKTYFFSTAFFFRSTDSKNTLLTQTYGEDIYGLNREYIKEYCKAYLTPEGRKLIKASIFKP